MKVELIENGPILVTTANDETIKLCRCGKTKTSPYCDDSHPTARRGMAALVIEEKPSRSDYRDWEYQNQLDEEEEREYNNYTINVHNHSCNCGGCSCGDSGCECNIDDE